MFKKLITSPPKRQWLSRLCSHPTSTKLFRFGKLGVTVGITEALIKSISFASGILVIRLLPTHEYAFYTIANTMLGTMSILADGGIGNAVMSEGGKVWQDKKKLGAVLNTGLRLRKQFALVSLLISLPVLYGYLHKNGVSLVGSVLIIGSIIPAFLASLYGKIFEVVPKLHQEVVSLQVIGVSNAAGRLSLTALFLFSFPVTATAILAAGLPQTYANWRLRKIASPFIDYTVNEDRIIRRKILKLVRRVMPGAVFFALKGHVSILLLGLIGTTQAVGELGALGRLAMVLSVFNVVSATIVVPRFARLEANKAKLRKAFLGILGLLCSTGGLIVLSVVLFPTNVLWVLGSEYSGLHKEVVLLAVMMALSLVSGNLYSLNASRGYLINPAILIPIEFVTIVIAYSLFPPNSTYNALAAGILIAAAGPPSQMIAFGLHWKNLGKQ